jgi:hypothetical protein
MFEQEDEFNLQAYEAQLLEDKEFEQRFEVMPLENLMDLIWEIKLSDTFISGKTGFEYNPLFLLASKLSPDFKEQYDNYIFYTEEYSYNHYNDDDDEYSFVCFEYIPRRFSDLKKLLEESKLITHLKEKQVFKDELITKVNEYLFHPNRVERFLDKGWINFGKDGFAETLSLEKNIPNYS